MAGAVSMPEKLFDLDVPSSGFANGNPIVFSEGTGAWIPGDYDPGIILVGDDTTGGIANSGVNISNVATTDQVSAIADALGTAAGYNVGIFEGELPELGAGGVLPSSVIPAIAISEFIGNVASQAAMLAVASGEQGDWVIRTDLGTVWTLIAADRTLLSSWQQMSYPTSPVSSVNGQTGVVVLTAANVGASPVGHDHDADYISKLAAPVANRFVMSTAGGELTMTEFTAATFAPAVHTHAIADTTGLTTALAGKASSTHTHLQSEVIDLEAALSDKADVGSVDSVANDIAVHEADLSQHVPSQSGHSGKYLKTNGTAASWDTVSGGGGVTLPSLATNAGKVLKVNPGATDVLWDVDEIGTMPESQDTYLASGGGVAWQSGYQYIVSPAIYFIRGTQYTSPQTTLTLGAAHASLNRIDVIALNTSNAAVVVAGTAAANPSEPDLDPETQLRLVFVVVNASTTAPTIATNDLYRNNAEWTMTGSAAIVVNSVSLPRAGANCIEGTNASGSSTLLFDSPGSTTVDLRTYGSLILYVRSKAAWGSRYLRLRWRLAGVNYGNQLTLGHGYYGFDSSNTTDYQQIAIPLTAFAVSGGQLIDQLYVTCAGSGGNIGFRIDDVQLQATTSSSAVATHTHDAADIDRGLLADARLSTNIPRKDTANVFTSSVISGVAVLADGATPALNAALGNSFELTAAGDRTIAVPTNATNGQMIVIAHLASGGARTLALNTGAGGFVFTDTVTALTATPSGKVDLVCCRYTTLGALNKWQVIGYSKGA